MRIKRYIAFVGFAVLASCGGTAERTAESEAVEPKSEEVVIDYDSLLRGMEVRYNELCEERKAAFEECDAERRRELIEANDRACEEFNDSLSDLLSKYNKE